MYATHCNSSVSSMLCIAHVCVQFKCINNFICRDKNKNKILCLKTMKLVETVRPISMNKTTVFNKNAM